MAGRKVARAKGGEVAAASIKLRSSAITIALKSAHSTKLTRRRLRLLLDYYLY